MKLSRVVIVLALAAVLGLASAGTADAAQKGSFNRLSYRASNVINGFSFSFIELLRLWRHGYRYEYIKF